MDVCLWRLDIVFLNHVKYLMQIKKRQLRWLSDSYLTVTICPDGIKYIKQ